VLVSALRELLPASPEVALRYTPTYSIGDGAPEFPRRSAVPPIGLRCDDGLARWVT
jgi:hypothetical protein